MFLRTRLQEQSDSDLQLHEMGKLSLYARKRIVNLHFCGENVSQITRKIRDEDAI